MSVTPAEASDVDGLSAWAKSITSARQSDSDIGLVLDVEDTHASDTNFDSYLLSGLPAGWTVKNGARLLQPVSPDPLIYSLPKDATLSGKISVLPPLGYSGRDTELTLSRVSKTENLITDFDGGSFDYTGTAKPQLPASNTTYKWNDPTVINTTSDNNTYGPDNGSYTVWPTASINGPLEHTNNYWADLRSIKNPLAAPTEDVCEDWTAKSPSYQVSEKDAASSGKILVVNADEAASNSNLITTTVTGLEPNTDYVFSGDIANLNVNPDADSAPAQAAFFAGDQIIGSSQPSPKQSSCLNDKTHWVHSTSVVNTGDSTSLTLGVQNYGTADNGKDLAIDNLSLLPMGSTSFRATVYDYPQPFVTVSKTAEPASGTPVERGDTITYTLELQNTGGTPLTNTVVTDDLSDVLDDADLIEGSFMEAYGDFSPVSAEDVTVSGNTLVWNAQGGVPTYENMTLTYKVRVKSNSTAAATLVNHVTATSEVPSANNMAKSNCTTGDEADCTTTHPIRALTPGLRVVKSADPASGTTVARGDKITYSVVAENTGETPLKNVDVTDDLTGVFDDADLVPGSLASSSGDAPTVSGNKLAWTGDLAVGAKVTLTYQVAVHDTAPRDAVLLNHVVAVGDDPDGEEVPSNCVDGTEPDCTTTHPLADTSVKIEKTDGKTVVGAGEETTYDVTVTNTGADQVTGVTATDELPAGVTFVSATDAGSYDPAVRQVVWSVGVLAAGASKTVHVTVKVDADVKPGQQIRNIAVVDTDQGCVDDPTTEPNECKSVDTDETPAISIKKTDNKVTVAPGEALTYSLTVTNSGTVPAENVSVADKLPAELEFVSAGQGGTFDAATGKVLWTIPSLAAGESTTVDVTANVAATVGAGVDIANVATVDMPQGCIDDPDTEQNECDSTDIDHTPAISIVKDDHETNVRPGQELTYDLVVKNASKYAAQGVTVSDGLPENLVFVSATNGGTYDAATRTVSWALGDLDGNSTQTVQVVATVADTALGDEIVSNTARVSTEQGCVDDPSTDQNECESTDVDRVPSISIFKTDNKTVVGAGEETTYDVTVTNTGTDQVTGVTATDVLPAGVTFVSASDGGLYDPVLRRVVWNVGTLEATAAQTVHVTVKVDADVKPGQQIRNIAIVDTDKGCIDDPTTDQNDCESDDVDETPAISIVKTDNKETVAPGEALTYTLTVTNTGTVAASDVSVTDQLPAELEFVSAGQGGTFDSATGKVSWSIPSLGAGASTTVEVTANVAATVGAGVDIANVATVDVPQGCIDDPDTDQNECESTDTDHTPSVSIIKTDNKTVVGAGEETTYDVTVTNTGVDQATGVVATDVLPAVVTFVSATDGGAYDPALRRVVWNIGTLPAGAVQTVHVTVTVDADVAPGQQIRNVAVLNTDQGCTDDPGTPANECESVDIDETPAISIKKTDNKETVAPGEALTYTLTVTNAGTVSAENLTVTDRLPAELEFVSAGQGGTYDATTGQVSWTIPSLAAGESTTVEVTANVAATIGAGAEIRNVASVDGPQGCIDDPSTDQDECDSTDIDHTPAISIFKTDNKTVVGAGEETTYDVTVTNAGTVPATGVTATDALPSGVTFVSASDEGSYDPALRRVVWSVGTLAAGAAQTVHVTVKVDADVKPGQQIRNVAIVDTDQGCIDDPTTDQNDCESVDVDETPAISIVKTDNKETVAPGEALTYTLTVTNTGTVAATDVSVTDQLPAELEFVSAGQGGTYDPATGNVSWSIPSLDAGASTTVEVTANVAAMVGAGVDIANVATVDVPQGCIDDPDTDQDECGSNDVDHTPAISIVKDDHETNVKPGQWLTYDLVVKNASKYPAKGVTVSDVLPENLVFVSATNGGTYDAATRTVSWSLGDMDANNTQTVQVVAIVADTTQRDDVVSNTARVSTEQGCVDDPSTDQNECESTDVDRVPSISIFKTDNKTVVGAGEETTYDVTVTNTGSVPATGVTATDMLPEGVTFVSATDGGVYDPALRSVVWNVGTLEAGAVQTVHVTVAVDADARPAQQIRNVAVVDSDQGCVDDPTTDQNECESVDTDETPAVKIEKTDNKETVAPGEAITYWLMVSNWGTVAAENVTVTDQLPAELEFVSAGQGGTYDPATGKISWTIPSLDAGALITVEVNANVSATVGAGADIANVATVDVPQGCINDPVSDQDECRSTDIDHTPAISIVKDDHETNVRPGQELTYDLVVKNASKYAAQSVTVSDVLPENLVFVSATNGGTYDAATRTVSWALGDMDGETTQTIQVVAKVADTVLGDEVVSNTARVSTEHGCVNDPTTDQNECESTDTDRVPSVSIVKTDNKTVVGAGEETTYDVTVTNTGTDQVTGVTATDVLPAGLTFVSATDGGAYDPALRRVTWNVGTLAAGAAQTVHVTATVDADVKPGQQIRNVAIVDTDQGCVDDPSTDQNECESVDVDETPAISIVKTDSKETVAPGEALTYTLTVTNAGTVAAENVTVTDQLPAELEFVSAGQGGTYDPATGNVSWTIPSLDAGASTTVEVTANVAATVGAGVDIANVATVDVPQGCIDDPDTDQDECGSTDVDHTPAISIAKDDHESIVRPGEQLTYDLVVTNKSQYAAKDVTVSDVLPQNLVFVSATNGGTYDAATRAVSWSLGDMDANSTQTIQVATTVADSVLGNEIVSNTARALTENVCVDDPTTDQNECESTDNDQVPAVSITKDDGKKVVRSGETLDYVLTAKNIGAVDAPNVIVTDVMPKNVDFVKSSIPGTQSVNDAFSFEWSLGTLKPGEVREIVVTVKVHEKLAPDTEIANTATITTDGVCVDDPATGVDECEATDIDVTPSDVWILKDDHMTEVKAGEELTYDLTVGNNSTTKTITDAVVTDSLPKNAVFVSATDGGVVSTDGKTVTWQLGELAPGAKTVVKVTVKVAADAKPGDEVLNTAVVDIPGGCVQEDACTSTDRDVLPKLSIVKTDHQESVKPSEKLTYDVTVTNETSVDAENAVVTDRLPKNVSYVSSSDGGSYDQATHTVTWSLGTLAGKAVKTVKVTVTVNADATREVVNVASVKTPVGCAQEGECHGDDVTVIDPPVELSPFGGSLAVTGGAGYGLLAAGAAGLLLLGAGIVLAVARRRKSNV
ncbi:DUF11 domain-containing protein [Leucobacter viscericola]|uniref:DUF11 domain-containing protein n=1 Tax=Leucobacter viscericola TaxID=2714935 RepID=A0A6G7XGQ0_9MICO|nr:isopeptide-forming domain-containing fimbrial protein [Leucobacter viscericola]QIK63723.1 DUF11 domain-containing protein [Leucobacter viscericola]